MTCHRTLRSLCPALKLVRLMIVGALGLAGVANGSFPSTEVFLPAVGRISGQGGAEFYTTVWATNLTGVAETFTFRFLKQGQSNASPASFTDTLAPGETKIYENVVQAKLGLTSAIGAARITSTGEILVAERIYNQATGADIGDTEGLFFAGVPKSFSIALGQSASIQGINQGGAENFRYNFALVETGGGSPTVNVQLFDGGGTLLGQKAYPLQPYEQLQPNVAEVFAGISTTNARIAATVTGGSGSVLLAGAQLANESQDSSGFEMSFRDELLGSAGGTAGVTSLNGLTGALTLKGGANVTVSPSGSTITISAAASGGGSGGLSFVTHDSTLAGDGSASAPLGLAVPLAISTANNNSIFSITNTGLGAAIVGGSVNSSGVYGSSSSPSTGGITGYNGGNGYGVWGTSANGIGVYGQGTTHSGVRGDGVNSDGVFGQTGDPSKAGVSGHNTGTGPGYGVFGQSDTGYGVYGTTTTGVGVFAISKDSGAIQAETSSSAYSAIQAINTGNGSGIYGSSKSSLSTQPAIWADNTGSGIGVEGWSHGGGWGVFGQSSGDAGHFVGNLTVTGNSNIMGTKHFIQPHPTDASKEIRFTSLEGPESGTYFRGSGRIVGGFARIEVPEAFRLVTSDEGLTVLTSPVGSPAVLTIVRESLDEIVVQGSSDVAFHYMVNGVRRGFEQEPVIAENTDFVPRSADDADFARNVPDEVLRLLTRNGILNADGTINRETAHRLGWDKKVAWNTPAVKAPRQAAPADDSR